LKDKERSDQLKKFKDVKLQALLDENSVQRFEKLAKALSVDKSTNFDRLHAMRKITKEGKWVPHELSKLAIQNCLIICISFTSL